MAAFQQNQLQFNLDVPMQPNSLAYRHHRPGPLILDKATRQPVGGAITIQQDYDVSQGNLSDVKFNSLSEDRMSMAVRLAKRDMKKKREEELIHSSRQRSKSPKTQQSKYIPGKDFWDKQQVRRSRDPKREKRVLQVKQHDRNRQPKTTRTQTPPRYPKSAGEGRVPDPSFPATSDSPPRRDTDFKLYPIKKSAPSDQPAKEIERLQREMESYLQQIQVIEQRALQEQSLDFLQPAKARKKGYLPSEEDIGRKQIRSDEQQTRAARQIYVLRQQVRDIQNQLIRSEPDKLKHTKKSQTMSRLAAAHRGAVRTIQTFVNNLPHTDLRNGLPPTYQELALLVRQMSLLSVQLGTEDQSSVNEDLLKMLDRVDELNKAWCHGSRDGVDTSLPQDPDAIRRRKSPNSRPPFEVPKPSKQPIKPTFVTYKGKENKPKKGVLKKAPVKSKFIQPKRRQQQQQGPALYETPDRKEMLHKGLAALLDAGEIKQREAGIAWDVGMSQSHPPATKKSLILPGKLQNQRMKAQRAVMQSVPESHYAWPTESSTIKAVPTQYHANALERSFSAPPSPRGHANESREPWRPSGTPKKPSMNVGRRARSQSPEFNRRPLASQEMNSSIAMDLFPDLAQEQNLSPRQGRSPGRQRMPLSASERLVNEAELAIRMKLNPLLAKAEVIANRQEKLLAASGRSVRQQLADKATENIELNGDLLTEMILADVIRDTANELESMEQQDKATKEAVTMQDSSTLENLFQRLEQMEQEQFDIRRRWATLEFEEEASRLQSKRTKGHYAELRPTAPAAMEITRHDGGSQRLQKNLAFPTSKEDEPIIFTKVKAAPAWEEHRRPQEEDVELMNLFGNKTRPADISVSKNVVENIHSHVEKYERYLKKTSHQSMGKFDPWKLVEDVSDRIFDDCLKEISEELEDVNEAIVNQVCKSEFMINSTFNSVQSSPGLSPQMSPAITKTVVFSEEALRISASDEQEDTETQVTYDDEDDDDFEDIDDDEDDDYDDEDDDDDDDDDDNDV